MTKAKEALDIFNKVDTGILESFDGKYKHILPPYYLKTIREALELLDKVDQGGVDTYDMCLDNCNYEEDNYDAGWNHAIAEINEKYILIERE